MRFPFVLVFWAVTAVGAPSGATSPEGFFRTLSPAVAAKVRDVRGYPGWKSILDRGLSLPKDPARQVTAIRAALGEDVKRRLGQDATMKRFLTYLERYAGLPEILLEDPEIRKLLQNGQAIADLPALRARLDEAIRGDLKKRHGEKGKEYPPPADEVAKDFRAGEKDAMPVRPPLGFAGKWKPDPPAARIDEFERPYSLGTRPTARGDLRKAGEKGNPAFEIAAHTGNGALGYCQMTLIRADSRECVGATADHCIRSKTGRKVSHFQTAYGAIIASDVRTIGSVQSTATDMAAVRFAGPACEKMVAERAPVLPVATGAPQPGDVVLAGVRFFGKVIAGTIAADEEGAVTADFDVVSPDGTRHEGGIHAGDSGGPLLRFNPQSQEWEIAGILSSSTFDSQIHFFDDKTPTVGGLEGHYATDLKLLREEKARASGSLP